MDPTTQGQPLILEVTFSHILILGGTIGVSVVMGFVLLGLILWYAISRLANVIGVLAREIRAARAEQVAVAESIRDSNAQVGQSMSELKGWLHGRHSSQ